MRFFLFLGAITTIVLPAWADENGLVWTSFDEGMDRARREDLPVLVDVYTDWCGWCKTMDSKTYGDENVAKYLNERFVLIKLNPEKDGAITYKGKIYDASYFSQAIGVNGYPATAFFESNEDMVTLVPGFVNAGDFLKILEFIGDKYYKRMSYSDFLKSKGYSD